jgi:hypothetical protein
MLQRLGIRSRFVIVCDAVWARNPEDGVQIRNRVENLLKAARRNLSDDTGHHCLYDSSRGYDLKT